MSDAETEHSMDVRTAEPELIRNADESTDTGHEDEAASQRQGTTVKEKTDDRPSERPNSSQENEHTTDALPPKQEDKRGESPMVKPVSPAQATEGNTQTENEREDSPVEERKTPSPTPAKKEDSFIKNYLSDSYSEEGFDSDENENQQKATQASKKKTTKPKGDSKSNKTNASKNARNKGKATGQSKQADKQGKERQEQKKKSKPKPKDEGHHIERKPVNLEPSLKWRNLGLFENEADSDEELNNTRPKNTPKPKQSRLESRRYTLMSERGRSVGTRTDTVYSESSTESEEEDDRVMDGKVGAADLPSEYWQIQRMIKFLKIGNPTATIICLCALRDFNLTQEMCQMAIRDVNGLQLLINLLKTESDKCKIGSLKLLQPLTVTSKYNRNAIINLGGVQLLVDLVTSGSQEVQGLAAATLANIAKASRARNILRRCGGIRKMVNLLNCGDRRSRWTQVKTAEERNLDLEVARCAALALWSCSTSMRNRTSIFKAGSVPLLAKLIKVDREDLLIPIVGLVQECAVEARYRIAFKNENMIEAIVRHLQTENQELQIYCANAIFKCAEDEETRDVVNKFGGLDSLVKLLSPSASKMLLAAVTGAIWKCSKSEENANRFLKLEIMETLMKFLQDEEEQPLQVQIHIAGALSELAKVPDGRREILACKGCRTLVSLSTDPNEELVEQVALAIAACSEAPDCRGLMNSLDGLRLVWSLLKSNNPKVVTSAAWAIHGLMEDTPEAWENARSFVGGLDLIVSLLKSDDVEVLTSACAAISNVANDGENIGVITDYGVVPRLASLTRMRDIYLRRHLAEAIARCCKWGNNARDFTNEGAVEAMVEYLSTDDSILKRSAVRALHQLARYPESCIKMHSSGVVKPLMEMVGSEDEALQWAAAGCLLNIRKLAMANEKARQEERSDAQTPVQQVDNRAT